MGKLKSVSREAYGHVMRRIKKLDDDSRAIHSEQNALEMELLRLRERIIRYERVFSEGPWELKVATATGELWVRASVKDFPTLHKDPIFLARHGNGLAMVELRSSVRFHEHDGEMTLQGSAKEMLKLILAYGIRVDASPHREQAAKFRETADVLDGLMDSVVSAQKRSGRKAKAKCASKPKRKRRSRSTRAK